MRVYLAGPMTGIPQFNFPAFDEAAAALRAAGYDVVSPAELDAMAGFREIAMASPDGIIRGQFGNETWGTMLARDVRLITDGGIEGVFVLPGWETSRGARLETFIAKAMNSLPIFDYEDGFEVGSFWLVKAWAGGLWDEVTAVMRTNVLTSVQRALGLA